MDLSILTDHRLKLKENEKRDKYADLARELHKTMKHKDDGDTNCNWCTWNNPERIGNRTERHGKKRMSGGHLDCSIIKVD